MFINKKGKKTQNELDCFFTKKIFEGLKIN